MAMLCLLTCFSSAFPRAPSPRARSVLLSSKDCVSTHPRSFGALPSMASTTFFAVALAEPGFWPVTRLPSSTTYETKGSVAFS